MDRATERIDAMHEAILLQRDQCAALGSDVYERLLVAIADDYADGGISHRVLAGRFERPIHDAAPLRLLGAVHLLALTGRAPTIAAHYPSCGGRPGPTLVRDFLGAVADNTDSVSDALSRQVQTNEVGRSVVHLSIAHWLGHRGHVTYDHLEVGASAGLNLNFDRFFADTGSGTMGNPASNLRFGPDWFDVPPPVHPRPATVRERRGCDPHPIDVVNDPAQADRLVAFIWPDQTERFERTRRAIAIVRANPIGIETASADDWVARQLVRPFDVPTVVFHSIVWQYLGREVQGRLRDALNDAGNRATAASPLYWIRMEPAGPMARVTATEWRGGEPEETVLCDIGYHGRDMRWTATND